jgi:hypothetical protein
MQNSSKRTFSESSLFVQEALTDCLLDAELLTLTLGVAAMTLRKLFKVWIRSRITILLTKHLLHGFTDERLNVLEPYPASNSALISWA